MHAPHTHSLRTARRLAGAGALALAALAAAAVPALAGGSAKPAQRHGGKTIVLRFYSVTTSFVYTTAAGKVLPQPPAKPSPGDRLELTDVDYKGNHAHHAKRWSVSDHTLCIFGSDGGAPTCDGQAAMGGNQLLLFHTPGGGAGGDTVVSGGTGRFAGATGSVAMSEIAGTNDSDIVLTVHLAK
jgi:hypothetical protein